ncbi:hypothetical protein EBZ39_14950, partial [bacterium]|nr:hypothetical protein [bacterium]
QPHIMSLHQRPILGTVITYLLTFVQTQLALTIVSLPILVHWGFGISVMTLVGNLVFTPVLTAFLFLCTLSFLGCLCNLPCDWLVVALNHLATAWHWLLSCSSHHWIIHCTKPPVAVLLMPLVALVGALWHPKLQTPARRLCAMSFILAGFFCYCLVQRYAALENATTVSLGEKLYAIVRADHQLVLVDEGFGGQKKSPEKAVDFQVLPLLYKKFGQVTLVDYIITKPTCNSMKIAAHICQRLRVTRIRLPYFDTPTDKATWWAYFNLKRVVTAQKIALVRFNSRAARFWRYKLRSRLAKDAPSKRHAYTPAHRGKSKACFLRKALSD